MFIILNGPLGIGKSTLSEVLAERINGCVMLDGDHLIAANPPHANEHEHLHSTIALLVQHHRRFGYEHFVINHLWRSPEELAHLRSSIGREEEFHTFLLTLPLDANLQRITRRADARAICELDYELETVAKERSTLDQWPDGGLGERFPVDAPPEHLADRLIARLGIDALRS